MPAAEKKTWQCGYDLDYLLEVESFYEHCNKHSLSPFSELKKHKIAAALKNQEQKIYEQHGVVFAMLNKQIVKSTTSIMMYHDVEIGKKLPGDVVITNLAWKEGHTENVANLLTSIHDPCWLYIWIEDQEAKKLAELAGFSWIGPKVSTFGELYGIYFKDASNHSLFPGESRVHPTRIPEEDYSLEKLNLPKDEITKLVEQLNREISELDDIEYTNHYSNYNKKKSWNAISLRGYTSDPAFITKPEEMNKKWKEENKDKDFHLQDTALRARLPTVEKLLDLLPGTKHRVRLMGLSPNGGELERHTDQVDPDCGVKNGKLMRFHFPLVTNPKVEFTSWGVLGVPKTINMSIGECWYLDVRKPHRAINAGDTNRIHLVIDVESNQDLRELINNDNEAVFQNDTK